jgi:siderophore synthetase component
MLLPHLYYLERYRNKGTRTYSAHAAYTDAHMNYQPESDQAQFELSVFDVPLDRVNLYTANPTPALSAQFIGAHSVCFCVHPQVIEQFPDDPYLCALQIFGTPLNGRPVVASASTRTLFALNPEVAHAIKVHFPFKVSRYTRKMRDEVVEQAIRVSEELEAGIEKMGGDFAFLREVIGITFKNKGVNAQREENWGFLVRDMAAYPKAKEPRFLVPGFALYGEDYHNLHVTPLLFDLIQDQDPVDFVLSRIMLPIMRHWIDCFRHFGYLLEPHGQNVLLELDSQNTIRRIVHRDLSVGIDMRRRRDLGLSSEHLNDYNRMEDGTFHSIAFDRFMGNHFFDRLVQACISRYPGVTEADFTQPFKATFEHYFPEHRDYMPQNIWYFSELRDRYNKPLSQDTGEVPKWRPAGD